MTNGYETNRNHEIRVVIEHEGVNRRQPDRHDQETEDERRRGVAAPRHHQRAGNRAAQSEIWCIVWAPMNQFV